MTSPRQNWSWSIKPDKRVRDFQSEAATAHDRAAAKTADRQLDGTPRRTATDCAGQTGVPRASRRVGAQEARMRSVGSAMRPARLTTRIKIGQVSTDFRTDIVQRSVCSSANELTALEVRRAVWNGPCYGCPYSARRKQRLSPSIRFHSVVGASLHQRKPGWLFFTGGQFDGRPQILPGSRFTVRGGVSVMAEKFPETAPNRPKINGLV